jgi:thiol-disulfide isomerase/thioredoxin
VRSVALALVPLGLAACGDNLVGAPPVGFEPPTTEDLDPTAGYPEAPPGGYGGEQNDILRDMRFRGYRTDTPSEVPVHELKYDEDIRLSQIRNLEGYTHLLITVAAEWCKPCREEAEILPDFFREWAGRGGYVLGVINQDRWYNTADRASVEGWARRYGTNYTLVHDPEAYVTNEFNPSTVPLNVVVELRTMRILRVRVGEDPDTFRFFEQRL